MEPTPSAPRPAAVARGGVDLALGIGAGICLGAFSRGAGLVWGPARWVANLGVPWLLCSFLVGAASRERRTGAVAGGLALAVAALVHYPAYRYVAGVEGLRLLRWPLPAWVAVGLPLGSLFARLGRSAVERRSLATAALVLGACCAAEAAYLVALFGGASYRPALAVEIPAAAALLGVGIAGAGRPLLSLGAGLGAIAAGSAGIALLDVWLRLY